MTMTRQVTTKTTLIHGGTYTTEQGGTATGDVFEIIQESGERTIYIANVESDGDAGALRGLLRQIMEIADGELAAGRASEILIEVREPKLMEHYARAGFEASTTLMRKA